MSAISKYIIDICQLSNRGRAVSNDELAFERRTYCRYRRPTTKVKNKDNET